MVILGRVSGTDLTHTFTGLTVGTTYSLKVRAKDNENAYGNAASRSHKLGNLKPTQATCFYCYSKCKW